MLKLYNTLTRKKDEFIPLTSPVRMYSCGPTVYSYAHIGNMRAYIFMDSVRRALEFCGFDVLSMMNITDVGHLLSDGDEGEDKLVKAGREQHKSPYEIAEIYTRAFMTDIGRLNIQTPHIIEKATAHIDEMLWFVEQLFANGFAYELDDGIYFDISRFDGYGKLSRLDLNAQEAGARVEVNAQKRHPADFALWKKAPKDHIMQWPSRWGMGYPGWHIECSALSRKFLGDVFDIHTGGIDHIPVHHENEIAQTECLTGKQAVNYWMHGGFMMMDGGKMSKSLNNLYTLTQLQEKGFSPLTFRYFCLNTHYRKDINFTFEALNAAKTAYLRLIEAVSAHINASESVNQDDEINALTAEFYDAVSDDVNLPLALGVLWRLVRLKPGAKIFALIGKMDGALGLSLCSAATEFASAAAALAAKTDALPAAVTELLEKRKQARANKDYKASDVLRDEIAALGYTVMDTKDGQTVKIKE